MIFLVLLWLCVGALVGSIAHAAQLRPASWQPFGWLRMAALGAFIAFCGGWIGVFLLGRSFATIMTLWITVVGVVSISWLSNGGTQWPVSFKRSGALDRYVE